MVRLCLIKLLWMFDRLMVVVGLGGLGGNGVGEGWEGEKEIEVDIGGCSWAGD